LTALGRRAELAEVYARWHAQVPDDPAVAHLLASARGDNPPAAPAAYLTQLFDHAAAGYDHLMVAQLDYRAPALIGAALDGVGVTRVGVALDLGCGTGLCGAVVGPRAARLVGVDLSAQMTAIAATTGRYDALEVGDALAHLATAAPYDLIVAADVLVYLGDLAPVAAAVRRALAPGGHWAFTVEDGGEAGYALGPVGRYAHHRAYVAEVLAAAGLTAIVDTPGVLRREGDAEGRRAGVGGAGWVSRRPVCYTPGGATGSPSPPRGLAQRRRAGRRRPRPSICVRPRSTIRRLGASPPPPS
jgi:predicted TPR repeat methyltransferase